jgi:outer membrane protein OmpA-like peptidoglycan-associated protein
MRFSSVAILCGILSTGGLAAGGAQPSDSAAASSFKVFSVYTEKGGRHAHFAPSGYMGDSDLSMSGAYLETPHGHGPCLRVTYKATGPKGWAGVYWQDPPNNWGDVPGRAGYDLRGATRLTFWARGEQGGERVHEFRVGGIVGQYPDSDVAILSNVRLTNKWKQYTIDLTKKDLRHIIAGFGLFLNKAEDSGGAVIYLTDILFEGPHSEEAVLSAVGPELTGQLPSETTVQTKPVPPVPLAPVVPADAKDLSVKQVDGGLKVSFSSRLMFKSGQSVLEPESGKVLDQLISLLSAYPSNRVLIEGHTDKSGDAKFNLRLSELRARSVRDYLIVHGGYDTARFQIIGYGDTKPIADNSTKAGRAINRRVEVTILKTVNP